MQKLPPALPTRPQEVQELIAGLELADESKLDLWRNYRAFWNWLEREKVADNIMAEVPAPMVRRAFPRTLEPGQIQRIFENTPSQRDRALMALPLNTGMRLAELANLQWPDVKADGLQVHGKTGPRFLPVSPRVRKLLEGLGDGPHIWTGRFGPLTRAGISQAISRVMYRAGIEPPKVGPHLLRHTFGRLYILNGGDVFSLQRLLGHRALETTMIYVHMNNRDLIDQHRRADPLRGIALMNPA